MADRDTPPREMRYRPNLARHRREFERYPNPVAWALPLAVLGIGVAAVMNLLPDIRLRSHQFARALERAHRSAVAQRVTPATPGVAQVADSLSAVVGLSPGIVERIEWAGGRVMSARLSRLLASRQLHLVVALPAAGDRPVSLFAERFVTRNVDYYRRRDTPQGRFYVSSEPAKRKAPPDSVVLWQEIGSLTTLIGSAPEDSLIAFAERMIRRGRAMREPAEPEETAARPR